MDKVGQKCDLHSDQINDYAICVDLNCHQPSLGCQECFILGDHMNHQSVILRFFNPNKMKYIQQLLGEQYCEIYERSKNNGMNQDEFYSLVDSFENQIIEDIDQKNIVQQQQLIDYQQKNKQEMIKQIRDIKKQFRLKNVNLDEIRQKIKLDTLFQNANELSVSGQQYDAKEFKSVYHSQKKLIDSNNFHQLQQKVDGVQSKLDEVRQRVLHQNEVCLNQIKRIELNNQQEMKRIINEDQIKREVIRKQLKSGSTQEIRISQRQQNLDYNLQEIQRLQEQKVDYKIFIEIHSDTWMVELIDKIDGLNSLGCDNIYDHVYYLYYDIRRINGDIEQHITRILRLATNKFMNIETFELWSSYFYFSNMDQLSQLLKQFEYLEFIDIYWDVDVSYSIDQFVTFIKYIKDTESIKGLRLRILNDFFANTGKNNKQQLVQIIDKHIQEIEQ